MGKNNRSLKSRRLKPQKHLAMGILVFFLCYFPLQVTGSQPSNGNGWPKLVEKVDDLVKDFLEEHHLVGATVAVTRDGRLLLSKGYGYATASTSNQQLIFKQMQPIMRTRIGSVSKVTMTGPTAYLAMREYDIDPATQKLYGTDGILGTAYNFDQEVGNRRFFPIVAIAISPHNRTYTWYVNGQYSVGSTRKLGKIALKSFTLPPKPTSPQLYRVSDIRAMAIARDGKVYTWYNDGYRSVGTPSDLGKYKKPKKDEKVVLPSGKTMLNIVGIAIAKSNDHVYVWYDDGTVSSGSSLNFTKYFSARTFKTPTTQIGSMSRYDIRGIGIANDDHVYIWYSNGKASSGTSKNFIAYRDPYAYTLPTEIQQLYGDPEYDPNLWWQEMTIELMMTHRLGFQRSGDVKGAATMFNIPKEQVTYQQVHKHFVRTRPLRWRPGKIQNGMVLSAYSNHGFGLWTLVIPAITGQSYREYATKKLITPLRLHLRVRPMTDTPDVLDATPYNVKGGTLYQQELKNATLGLAAGGWTASAQSLLWITRYLSQQFSKEELTDMGWNLLFDGKNSNDRSLSHNGLIDGGTAQVMMFPEGYRNKNNKDLSNIHVAIALNVRVLNKGDDNAKQKMLNGLYALARNIGDKVPDAKVPVSYNLWGGLPELMFVAVSEAYYPFIFEHGYQLEWVDAYTANGRVYFNAIFRPQDGTPWVARHGLTAAQFQSEFNKWTSKGFRLHQIESYVKDNKIRFAAIFKKESGPPWRAYHNVSTQKHQQLFNTLSQQGYVPKNISVVSVNNTVRVSALYEKKGGSNFVSLTSIPVKQFQNQFNQNRKAGRRLVYLNAWQYKGKPYFSAIWQGGQKTTYKSRHGIQKQKLLSEREKLSKKGFLTEFITGYATSKGMRFAALWQKSIQKYQIILK